MNADFHDILLEWYDRNGRDLPWRQTRDPYRIWLSEVILQQTRVAQGLAYYLRFTERFPDVRTLADAPETEVLKLWQGLGYYTRARNLRTAARQIVELFDGRFPDNPETLKKLRGVGEYTAAAICSAAFDLPCAVVDGNVYRVLARLFDIDCPIDSSSGKRTFARLAQTLIHPQNPGKYNQAIMDFGALVCSPANPGCAECPFENRCLARAAGSVADRPVKKSRTQIRNRWFNYLHISCNGMTPICQRGPGDIWHGLYEFPLIETPAASDFAQISRSEEFIRWTGNSGWSLVRSVGPLRHKLSHQTLHTVIHRITVDRMSPAALAAAVPEETLADLPVPRLIDRYLSKYHT